MNQHVWWYVARGTGVTAWALSAASVLWGMALSTRALGAKPRAPWLLDLHRYLGGLTVLFVLAHIGALLGDSYIGFSLEDVLVPFATEWRPVAVALGIVAAYLLVAVEVSSLVKKRLSKRVWRSIHLSSYAVYLLASLHFLLAGADAANVVSRVALIVTTSAGVFFVVYLAIGPGRAASVRPAGKPVTERSRRGEPAPCSPASAPGTRPGRQRSAPARSARPAPDSVPSS